MLDIGLVNIALLYFHLYRQVALTLFRIRIPFLPLVRLPLPEHILEDRARRTQDVHELRAREVGLVRRCQGELLRRAQGCRGPHLEEDGDELRGGAPCMRRRGYGRTNRNCENAQVNPGVYSHRGVDGCCGRH